MHRPPKGRLYAFGLTDPAEASEAGDLDAFRRLAWEVIMTDRAYAGVTLPASKLAPGYLTYFLGDELEIVSGKIHVGGLLRLL